MVLEPRTRIGMPLDEFVRDASAAPFEWVDGRRIPLMPRVAGQIVAISDLLAVVYPFAKAYPSVGDFWPSATYVLLNDAGQVVRARRPSVAFYAADRWDDYVAHTPDWGNKPFVLVPDLCVEVVSKNDLFGDVQRKAALYLEDGVLEVWVVSPDDRSLLVYTAGLKTIARLTAEDTLTSPLLPEFALRITALFPA
jgi:Uma2 family endonuclease